MAVTSYTEKLTMEQAVTLRGILEAGDYEFKDKPYTLFAASKSKLQISVYQKGPKVLVQGKEAENFVRDLLEPEVFEEIRLGHEEQRFPERFAPHIGVDESGKGDFFGPLVISGVYVNVVIARRLLDVGICDSKRISSDARIHKLADAIRKIPGLVHDTIVVAPERYNELYVKVGNVNKLLAWAHAAVMANLSKQRPDCPRALSDQFASDPRLLERAAEQKHLTLMVEQRIKAESDPAVAAASILAREAFILWLEKMGSSMNLTLPRGASRDVQGLVHKIRQHQGEDLLATLAKTHFKISRDSS